MKSCSEVAQIFNCEKCDYNTSKQSSWKKHILTSKHILETNGNAWKQISCSNNYNCINCKKCYKTRAGIWKHQKICMINSNTENTENTENNNENKKLSENELILFLLKENNEFKQLIMDQSNIMIDQSSKMLELATKPSTINNNNNCHNKQFNLNVFLNEKCKDAMNINEFINSLQIVSEDFEDIGKLGYIQGISNIFIKGLKELDETVRPMHCTDKKRETLYIKDIEGWNKDNNKDKIKTVIKEVADKNLKYIPIWQEDNPTYYDGTTKKNDQYMRIVNQVMTAIVPDDETGLNKIIKNVVNEICVDK